MLICGIDEAGRGPLAGPVVAAAVIFESDYSIEGVKDSKVISHSKRKILFDKIIDECVEYKICEIDNNEIDEINILRATMRAMMNCINLLQLKPEIYLIDGNYFKLESDFQNNLNYKTIIDGDASEFTISSASILAKVYRDDKMEEFDKIYPQYLFKNHKGYGTREHIKKIMDYGLSPIHRKTFCGRYGKKKLCL